MIGPGSTPMAENGRVGRYDRTASASSEAARSLGVALGEAQNLHGAQHPARVREVNDAHPPPDRPPGVRPSAPHARGRLEFGPELRIGRGEVERINEGPKVQARAAGDHDVPSAASISSRTAVPAAWKSATVYSSDGSATSIIR